MWDYKCFVGFLRQLPICQLDQVRRLWIHSRKPAPSRRGVSLVAGIPGARNVADVFVPERTAASAGGIPRLLQGCKKKVSEPGDVAGQSGAEDPVQKRVEASSLSSACGLPGVHVS